jgi:hypothetical protein
LSPGHVTHIETFAKKGTVMAAIRRCSLTCLREAEQFLRSGNRRLARKRLEQALRELRRPMQRLPAWVVPGVEVQWMGDPPRHVYKVVSVNRSKPDWWFQGERVDASGQKEVMGFHRETGKRYWRRHG